MITLNKVNKYFNRHKSNEIHVINDTSLSLPDKGLISILGPSGCGKTTLLNVIGGLDNIANGSIVIDDNKISHKSSHYIDKIRVLNIGYDFQNYNLIEDKTVFDNVALSLKMIGITDKDEINEKVNYVLEKLNIYRYRNKLAKMLSGGERQRVGIARALVKNSKIIICDEPTGNLDSTNTLEIMNILKAISKDRLVLLVTHENDIAKFYSDEIIELVDGKVVNNYLNDNNESIDYRENNKFYLKDFSNVTNLKENDNEITIYNDEKNNLELSIVVKHNNVYIKGNKNLKIEVVDDNSNIEFINDNYKKIDKNIYEKYEFDTNLLTSKKKIKYASIYNMFSSIKEGYQKVANYSKLKKVLLLGFFFCGLFITYSICAAMGITNIKDSYFVTKNKDYYVISSNNININDIKDLKGVNYYLYGDSMIKFTVYYKDFYQTSSATSDLNVSLTDINMITKDDLIVGNMPTNEYEIVVDKMAIEDMIDSNFTMMMGYDSYSDFIGKKISMTNMDDFTIVGITDKVSKSVYVDKKMFNSLIYNNTTDKETFYEDYTLSNFVLKEGRLPENDYEVLVNIKNKDFYSLNSKIGRTINKKELTVVGYYEDNNTDNYYVNSNMIDTLLAANIKSITIMPSDITSLKESSKEKHYSLISTYDSEKAAYITTRKDIIKSILLTSMIILIISFVEIYLMIRSSYLTRVKEVGVLRAIGVKKSDVCKMFAGEILFITFIASIPGCILMYLGLKALSTISYFEEMFLTNYMTLVISILLVLIFNIVIGLCPVFGILLQKPAKILARKDVD